MAGSDKTEKPTPKKERDSRKEGKVARSKDLTAAVVYLGMLGLLVILGAYAVQAFQRPFLHFWRGFLGRDVSISVASQLMVEMAWNVFLLASIPLILTLMLGVGGSLLQGGIVFSAKAFRIKPESFNPASNLKRVFATHGLMELGKALALVLCVGYLAGSILYQEIEALQRTAGMEPRQILGVFGSIVLRIALRVGIFLAILGLADYLFKRYRHSQDLMQSKEEVKRDFKDMEGQPLVKSRIRQMQRELAKQRTMQAVATADVVVTNPTEYAVALKYEVKEMSAPRLVAKGRGHLARKIKEIARQHDVPTVENVALAQAIYKSVEVDSEIPEALYKAVAQVLAYVFKLNDSRS